MWEEGILSEPRGQGLGQECPLRWDLKENQGGSGSPGQGGQRREGLWWAGPGLPFPERRGKGEVVWSVVLTAPLEACSLRFKMEAMLTTLSQHLRVLLPPALPGGQKASARCP